MVSFSYKLKGENHVFKKITAFILAAAITLAFTACSGKETSSGKTPAEKTLTAEEIYKTAAKKNQDATTTDMSIDMKIDMTADGESISMNMSMRAMADMTDENNIKLGVASVTSIPEMGDTKVNYAYIKDTIYVDAAGIKYKSAVTPEVAESIMGNSSANEIINAEIIKDAELTKDGDNSIITFKFDESLYNDILNDSMGEMTEVSGISYEFKDVTGTAVIDSDYNLKSIKVTMSAVMTNSEAGAETGGAQSAEMNLEMDITVNSIGEPVEISAPSDIENYTDISADMLTGGAA